MTDIVFGPVPSRRLGRSLGVNNIPYKVCSYSCIYCQLGRTLKMDMERRKYYEPQFLFERVKNRIRALEESGEKIDYITFVPDGEPTLDKNLGNEARLVSTLGYRTAIITNASLMWREDVREDLREFSLVSVKVDAITPELWRRINRPHKSLRLAEILEGIRNFSRTYEGLLISETMLVKGVDYVEEARLIANFLSSIGVEKAYISVPTRPPAELGVEPPDSSTINMVYNVFKENGLDAYILAEYEGPGFTVLDKDVVEDILSIVSVHPMRLDDVIRLLEKRGITSDKILSLEREGFIDIVEYMDKKYVVRRPKMKK
jgi:wyosine [tRNA(Phe)-imidazoG37] synthetase (radical SAM superfamily)